LDARPGGPPDVRWKRQLSDPIEPPEHVAGYVEPEPPPAVSERREPLAFAVREAHALTDPGRSAHESLPRLAVLRTLDEEDLELASRRSAPAHTRTDDTRVVYHQQVARTQRARQIAHVPIHDRALPARAHEQARIRPHGGGSLRDAILGELV